MAMRPQHLARVQTHAQILIDQGSWCSPSCVAQCGKLVLSSQKNVQTQIVTCFKDFCGCKQSKDSYPDDQELLTKYHADQRLEHLLLEKEIKDILLQSESSELSLIQTEIYSPQRHNKLLETIVYKSIKPKEELNSFIVVYIFVVSVMAIVIFRFASK
jgi:hypothetical protein